MVKFAPVHHKVPLHIHVAFLNEECIMLKVFMYLDSAVLQRNTPNP